MLRNTVGGGGCQLSRKNCYEGVRFNVISVTRGWVGVEIPGKKRYVTLEWLLILSCNYYNATLKYQPRHARARTRACTNARTQYISIIPTPRQIVLQSCLPRRPSCLPRRPCRYCSHPTVSTINAHRCIHNMIISQSCHTRCNRKCC